MWRSLLEARPDLFVGFRDDIDSDYGEGMYVQSVYPHTGVGREFMDNRGPRKKGTSSSPARGMGRFAFNPAYHLTESSTLATPEARVKLFNQWGFYWGRENLDIDDDDDAPPVSSSSSSSSSSPRVLLEKTPSNMIMSRFLQRMFAGSRGTFFLFIRRHPLATALAQERMGAVPGLSVRDLVAHWVQQHRILREDLDRLQHVRTIRFEDFVREPGAQLRSLVRWIEGHDDDDDDDGGAERAVDEIDPHTNEKYETEYCARVRDRPGGRAAHDALVESFGEEVRSFGYDLNSFRCLQDGE